ncbi:hypothetical protein ACFS4T_11425 [Pseudomonas lini]
MPELKCEKVNDTYILRDGASGLFLAASQFPKKTARLVLHWSWRSCRTRMRSIRSTTSSAKRRRKTRMASLR